MNAVVSHAVGLKVSAAQEREILKDLTVKVYVIGEKTPTVVNPAFRKDGFLWVPRQYGLRYLKSNAIPYEEDLVYGLSIRPGLSSITLYDDQQPWANEIVSLFRRGERDVVAKAFTGFGKCLGIDTPVVMYDGSITKVQDIAPGDLLMGPDSTPREVVSTAAGRGMLYKIESNSGTSFVCNGDHVLNLKTTRSRHSDVRKTINITVADYLNSSKGFKHLHKLWTTGVEIPEQPIPVDPYIVGVYLGDGTRETPCITISNADEEIYQYVDRWVTSVGLSSRYEEGRGCSMVYIKSGKARNRWFNDFVLHELVDEVRRKRIPEEYLCNSRGVRLQVLAGLIDSDGTVAGRTVYDIIFKDKPLAYDTARLARSLGFKARVTKTSKSCGGFTGIYYRITITGDTDEIPCKVERKKIKKIAKRKDHTVSGFSVTPLSVGDYYGFELSGDGLFLLGDYTVTHNTVVSLEVFRRLGKKALVIVDQEFLRDQWISSAVKYLNMPKERIGVVQGSRMEYRGKDLVVAMVQSLTRKAEGFYPQEFFNSFGVILVDEQHAIGSEVFSKALMMFPAACRLGVTATPRTDGFKKLLELNMGEVKVEASTRHKQSTVRYVQYRGVLSWYANISPKSGRYISEIAADTDRNLLLADIIFTLWKTGRDVLAISDRCEQLEDIMELCAAVGLPEDEMAIVAGYETVWAYSKDPTPARAPDGWDKAGKAPYTPVSLQLIQKRISRKELTKRKNTARVILATYGMFSKGVDVPRLSAGVDCTPRAKAQQVHGRILRSQSGKLRPIWVTIRDVNSYKAEYQFAKRLQEYAASNVELFLWDLEKGVALKELSVVSKSAGRSAETLKKRKIVTQPNGLHKLV